MSRFVPLLGLIAAVATNAVAAPEPDRHWPFETAKPEDGRVLGGGAASAAGVEGNGLRLDGRTVVEVADSSGITHGVSGFTLTVWLNPYALGPDQQMIAAKNRYSLNEREWGVMIDKDGKLRLYAWQGGWKTVAAEAKPKPGHWHHVGVVSDGRTISLWVDGEPVGGVPLKKPLSKTSAPLTFGGVNDNGRIWQNLFGALDQAVMHSRALSPKEMAALYRPVEAKHDIPERPATGKPRIDPTWANAIERHAEEDQTTIVFDGKTPDKLACDTTLRAMPDGSWVMIMLGGGDTEPLPQNRVFITRSHDRGKTWSAMEPIDLGVKAKDANAALVPSELMVRNGRCTMFVATHDGTFANWREWMTHSDDSCRTWSALEPAPGRLRERTFIRNHIVTKDGRILLPFQHYLRVAETRKISKSRLFSPPTNPRNGVLMSDDGGRTWTEHGDIRITTDDNYSGWAENNVVELGDGRIAMIIRADRLGGVLYYAESKDGGRTWPEFARKTNIPNPGSKATLYSLGGDSVALLHNPNPRHRSPLALWVSFDGLKTWPYQRVLVPESVDGPKGRLNYPDGFVGPDKSRLHFAFDDNRHRAVHVAARLPRTPEPVDMWDDEAGPVPKSAGVRVLDDIEFRVIKKWEPKVDGFHWLHGVALAWHKGRLFASFGHNVGKENTLTEEGRWTVSDDGGATWSKVKTMDAGTDDPSLAVSHGVFLSRGEKLWVFMGAFHDTRKRVHTRAYSFDEESNEWRPRGVVVEGGFWPMQQPVKMADGNWLMAGFIVGQGNPAAVAISDGDDLLKWDLVVIPKGAGVGRMWGESTVIAHGSGILNIARYGDKALALASRSSDHGRTWTPSVETDLPMTTSKPAAGILSTGQRYLVCSTTADGGGRRYPLTIAVSRPGEAKFSKVFAIRRAEFPEGPGESHPRAALSYPYAIENDGTLYIGYSNAGGRGGNQNSAELAVIPVEKLR